MIKAKQFRYVSQIIIQRNEILLSFLEKRFYHHWSSYSLRQRITIAIQIFAILVVLCLPIISIAALVLTLAVLNMSFGIRRFYVKILTFVFDYATKIKKDKEISIDSDMKITEPATPQIDSLLDDSIEFSLNTSMKKESTTDDDDELDNSQTIQIERSQRTSRASSQTDRQFKLSKEF
jgi:hypothetical protein